MVIVLLIKEEMVNIHLQCYNETTWTHQQIPLVGLTDGVTIEVTLDGPCCDNRIPNCSDTSKFTGRAILLGGNVKNRTCVAQRCQCPNCP